jgi:hypothetical protein
MHHKRKPAGSISLPLPSPSPQSGAPVAAPLVASRCSTRGSPTRLTECARTSTMPSSAGQQQGPRRAGRRGVHVQHMKQRRGSSVDMPVLRRGAGALAACAVAVHTVATPQLVAAPAVAGSCMATGRLPAFSLRNRPPPPQPHSHTIPLLTQRPLAPSLVHQRLQSGLVEVEQRLLRLRLQTQQPARGRAGRRGRELRAQVPGGAGPVERPPPPPPTPTSQTSHTT